jgi:4-amino-4-deoxy-L-arabinose transferase-like glycosyltransferase
VTTGRQQPHPDAAAAAAARRERLGLLVLLAAAAAVRFVDLPGRGTWDADQGHDMLVLRAFVQDGAVPLLGPPTSIGAFHHGALYYWLLAPVAALSGVDPLAVVAAIAAAGVAAVGVVWWLARAIAGPVAGFAAAGLMAVSTSAIEESTFIWNPNLIALSSAVALAAAWQAWTTGRARWWIVAAAGQAVTMHCHVLGAVLLVPLAGYLVADARRRTTGSARRRVLLAGAAGIALIAASYIPLLVSELGSGFGETRALVEFVTTDSDAGDPPIPVRLALVWLRVLSWPLTGLVTAQPVAAILVTIAILAILAWRSRAGAERERRAATSSFVILAWSATALAVISSSLARVVPGLPNDHYHAFLDPVVFVAAGLGVAALWRRDNAGRIVAAAGVAAVVALNVAIWPPRVAPDGGYPAAERAAARILQAIGSERYLLDGLPASKNADAYGFPLIRLGGVTARHGDFAPNYLVIACDRLLEPMIGASCGGAAEDARAAVLGEGQGGLVERFDASSRTVISIYR